MAKKSKELKLPKVEILPSGTRRCRATVKVLIETPDGPKVVKKVESFTGETEEDCIAAYLAYKRMEPEERAVKVEEIPKTLAQAMDEYIQAREKTKSPSTIRGYYIIRENAYQQLMGKPLNKITRKEWQDAIDADVVAGKSAKTVKNRFDLVKAVMKDNNMQPPKLSMPSVAKSRDDTENFVRFLDDAELKVFCAAIRGKDMELMCYLALNGLRCSEVYGMTWDKINLKTEKITVSGAVVPDSDNVLVFKDENKNATSKRTVPILYPRLIELVNEADKSKPITNCTPNWFYKWINSTCSEAGLSEVGIHGLRHTGASLCVYQGIKKRVIMQWFGWSVPDTLDKIYTHISNRQIDLEAKKIQNVVTNL